MQFKATYGHPNRSEVVFSGTRVRRGLYCSSLGTLINASDEEETVGM